MSDRDHRVQTYLTEQEYRQLSEWSDETGKSMSSLLREAVLEYTDNDRSARLEDQLDDLHDKMDDLQARLSDDSTHTHKNRDRTPRGSSATEKLRAMVRRIQENHNPVFKADRFERAIEDYAGADARTEKKYKRLAKKRGLLFEHPGDKPLWTVDRGNWIGWLKDYAELNGSAAFKDEAEDYPVKVFDQGDELCFDWSDAPEEVVPDA